MREEGREDMWRRGRVKEKEGTEDMEGGGEGGRGRDRTHRSHTQFKNLLIHLYTLSA